MVEGSPLVTSHKPLLEDDIIHWEMRQIFLLSCRARVQGWHIFTLQALKQDIFLSTECLLDHFEFLSYIRGRFLSHGSGKKTGIQTKKLQHKTQTKQELLIQFSCQSIHSEFSLHVRGAFALWMGKRSSTNKKNGSTNEIQTTDTIFAPFGLFYKIVYEPFSIFSRSTVKVNLSFKWYARQIKSVL